MRVGDIVLLSAKQCYRGCIGIVVKRHDHGQRAGVLEIEVPGLGTVVRSGLDLKGLDPEDITTGAVVGADPCAIVAVMELDRAHAELNSAIYNGRDAETAALADTVVRMEEANVAYIARRGNG